MDQEIISFAPEWSILINHSFKFFNCYLDKIYFKLEEQEKSGDCQGLGVGRSGSDRVI